MQFVVLETALGPLAPAHWSEFIVGLIFAVIVVIGVQKFVVPRFEQMYEERSAQIEGGINRAQIIEAEAAKTKRDYEEQLAASREAATSTREQAREQAAVLLAEARARAQREHDQMVEQGRKQIAAERDQAFNDLKSEIGVLATRLAERIVDESLEDSEVAKRTIDHFLDDLESQPSLTPPDFADDVRL